jgi:polyisoprenoid-binding protein YceI
VSAPVGADSSARFTVSRVDSWMTFEARSNLHAVHGKTTDLDGYIEAGWNADGTLVAETAPKMHVEFPVERLRSGNGMQDREMWKLIDSKRFPRVTADLRKLQPASSLGRYTADGDITLAGRPRKYQGDLTFARSDSSITIDGELDVDIRDFGLRPPQLLIMKVDPKVTVRLHLVARSA